MVDYDRIAEIVRSSMPEFNYLDLLQQKGEHRPKREGPFQPRSRHFLQKVQKVNPDYAATPVQ